MESTLLTSFNNLPELSMELKSSNEASICGFFF